MMRIIERSLRVGATAGVLSILVAAGGCTYHPTQEQRDQQIREESAQAARQLKEGAKNAAHELGDVAVGVKQGLQGKTGSGTAGNSDKVDINSASEARLAMLPGVSLSQARAIVKNRPYSSTRSLVKDGVLTRDQYDHIADRITAQ
jgi:DNA uptake protein ComE-like DNA-binding protein